MWIVVYSVLYNEYHILLLAYRLHGSIFAGLGRAWARLSVLPAHKVKIASLTNRQPFPQVTLQLGLMLLAHACLDFWVVFFLNRCIIAFDRHSIRKAAVATPRHEAMRMIIT